MTVQLRLELIDGQDKSIPGVQLLAQQLEAQGVTVDTRADAGPLGTKGTENWIEVLDFLEKVIPAISTVIVEYLKSKRGKERIVCAVAPKDSGHPPVTVPSNATVQQVANMLKRLL